VWAQLEIVERQLEEVRHTRAALQPDPDTPTGRFVRQLQTVRAVGPMSAWVLTTEIFGWREIRNGRQLGALVGLAPAPYHSGETQRDHGIRRAGNAHVRRAVVKLACGWVRYQPPSALTQVPTSVGGGSRRARKIGIVALARKLLVALGRYVETGAVPVGAQLKVMAG
jgi:transposase